MTKYNNNVTDKHAALRPVARLLIPGGGAFSSYFGHFSAFENWSSQWLSRGHLDF